MGPDDESLESTDDAGLHGITAMVFSDLVHVLKQVFATLVSGPPLRPALGGVLVLLLTALVSDRTYLGLSIPLSPGRSPGAPASPPVRSN